MKNILVTQSQLNKRQKNTRGHKQNKYPGKHKLPPDSQIQVPPRSDSCVSLKTLVGGEQ